MDKTAYDRSPFIFSPDGRIHQIEYAQEAAKRGSTIIGITYEDGVILWADKTPANPLIDTKELKKIYSFEKYAIGVSGLYGDTVQYVNHIIEYITWEEYKKGEIPTLREVILESSRYIHEFTLLLGTRPLGINILIASKDELYRIGCAGEFFKCNAWAIGNKSDEIIKYLSENYKKPKDLESALKLLKNTLKTIKREIKDYELIILNEEGINYREVL